MKSFPTQLIVLTFAVTACADEAAPIEVTRTNAEIRVNASDGATVIDISDPGGIGRAELKRSGKKWPEKLVLRLRLKGLESLKVTVGENKLGWWVAADPAVKTYMSQWVDGKETSLTSESPWWSEVKRVDVSTKSPRKEGYFELTLPARMFAENPEIMHIAWVDFFRG